MNVWELIFMQSPANNGYYQEERLPQQTWEWPKGTWFQSRLDFVRKHQSPVSRRTSSVDELRTM